MSQVHPCSPLSTFKKIKYFKQCVYKWIKYFELTDFEIYIDETNIDDCRASCHWHHLDEGAQQLTILFSKQWIKNKYTCKEEIETVAFHEVCECLLSEINQLCRERFVQRREVTTAIHRIIRRLENSILKHK